MILMNKKVVVIWIWKHVKLSCPFPRFRSEKYSSCMTLCFPLVLLQNAVAALGAKTGGL